jgi:hypothetical protein
VSKFPYFALYFAFLAWTKWTRNKEIDILCLPVCFISEATEQTVTKFDICGSIQKVTERICCNVTLHYMKPRQNFINHQSNMSHTKSRYNIHFIKICNLYIRHPPIWHVFNETKRLTTAENWLHFQWTSLKFGRAKKFGRLIHFFGLLSWETRFNFMILNIRTPRVVTGE